MSKLSFDKSIQKVVEEIKRADGLVILAGAGMGVDSGLPDFRGEEGLWTENPILEEHGLSLLDIATPSFFENHPRLAWGFYGHRLNLYREAEPHRGFEILKSIGEQLPLGYFVYTSNVDGQFQKAGFAEDRILECHGSLHYVQNLKPEDKDEILSAEWIRIELDEQTQEATAETMPYAEDGGLLRPNVLLFDDAYWQEDRKQEQLSRYKEWLQEAKKHNVVAIEIGAGDAVATVRCQSLFLEAGSFAKSIIQINPDPADYAQIVIQSGALEALEAIEKGLKI